MNPRPLTKHALQERLPSWGVLVLESHHGPQFSMQWRRHSFLKVVYVLQGRGQLFYESEEIDYSTGDVLVVAPGVRNRVIDAPGSQVSLYIGCFSKSLFRFDSDLIEQVQTRLWRGDGHFANRVASHLRRLMHLQNGHGDGQSLAMVADGLRLVQHLYDRQIKAVRRDRLGSYEQSAVTDYVARLRENFFDQTDIDSAARELGIPRRTFTQLFQRTTGTTWLKFVRGLAIEHAQRRLRDSSLSIASIAFESGFNDLSTFYRQFRQHTGCTPAQFRSQESTAHTAAR